MKFLSIPYDIRHWGRLLPEPYHTFEPHAGSVSQWCGSGRPTGSIGVGGWWKSSQASTACLIGICDMAHKL